MFSQNEQRWLLASLEKWVFGKDVKRNKTGKFTPACKFGVEKVATFESDLASFTLTNHPINLHHAGKDQFWKGCTAIALKWEHHSCRSQGVCRRCKRRCDRCTGQCTCVSFTLASMGDRSEDVVTGAHKLSSGILEDQLWLLVWAENFSFNGSRSIVVSLHTGSFAELYGKMKGSHTRRDFPNLPNANKKGV